MSKAFQRTVGTFLFFFFFFFFYQTRKGTRKKMNSLLLNALALLMLFSVGSGQSPVVVFVHGLYGWGPDEVGGILRYWNKEYLEEFTSRGIQVKEASVGPISSNWDRACELYAQIKGVRTDYGKHHSSKFGHDRFGTDYSGKGLYPEWSAINKVHFIGHSLGGNTIRYLEALLQKGDADEQEETGNSTSELFQGVGNWISSISAISSPLDGSPTVSAMDTETQTDILQEVLVFLSSFTEGTAIQDLYDFDLDHWNLGRNIGESFSDYLGRIKSSPLLADANTDVAFKEDIEELFARTDQTYPGTYYFGYATHQTFRSYRCEWFPSPRCGYVEKPRGEMWFVLAPSALLLGGLGHS